MFKKLRTVNIEEGMPDRYEAVLRLQFEISSARRAGYLLLKVIHGYGSSGVGGVLKSVVLGELRRLKEQGEIRAFVPGENWRISDETTWPLLKQFSELKKDSDLGRDNKGITIVHLGSLRATPPTVKPKSKRFSGR